MSSSVFIEPSTAAKIDKESGKHNPESNLVVVYGKNGINIDKKDLENFMEEKAKKTISVIRITSPTPSMEEAEEAERLEAAKEADDATDDGATDSETKPESEKNADNNDSSSLDSEDGENSSGSNEGTETKHSDNSNDDEDNDDDCRKSSRLSKRIRNNRRNTLGNANTIVGKKQETKKSTQVMGLTLEGFYEADAALEIAKEACKIAGIPYIRNTAEYEFMLFVIRNDHCYTPYTSPEQMKAKLAADKLEAEKLSANMRKLQPQLLNTQSKQILNKARKLPVTVDSNSKGSLIKNCAKIPIDKMVEAEQKSLKDDDDEESFELIDVEDSEYTGSDQSAESDNDRESDLDFNVNNRPTKLKRRISVAQKKTRRLLNTKTQDKRNNDERPTELGVPNVTNSGSIINPQRPQIIKSQLMSNNTAINTRQITSVTKGHPVTAGSTGKTFTVAPLTPIRTSIGSKISTTAPRTHFEKTSLASQSAVKEIVINKVLSSPKGCFTEITTLISEAEKSTNQNPTTMHNQPVAPITTSQNTSINPSSSAPSRTGFMRIDTIAKNALPAQISVDTHQSSSELLAAEHDKQLDLIDSIVKDELNKSLDNVTEKPTISTDETIKLVQMLENTEKALESNNLAHEKVTNTNTLESCMDTTSNNTNNHVDDIDISQDLPEELLQHVVELMKDDKTLQEAVEKEILEQENNFALSSVAPPPKTMQQLQPKVTAINSNLRTIQLLQQNTAQRSPPRTPTTPANTTSKSIIEMSISNTPSSPAMNVQPHTPPSTRRDPIQIIRGNGRVITLPPIEAPTTRAKRRAQVVPNLRQLENSQQTINESSLDNSLQSNVSFGAISRATSPVPSEVALSTTNEQKIRDTTSKRRISKESNVTTTTKSSRKSSSTSKSSAAKSKPSSSKQEDTEASESQGDDDDPKRLWCICRQPHNNRFMICCDACGDWFHGTCVNVTKAMGREMEQKGLEWSCPQCNKKREERTQRKLTDMLQRNRKNSQCSNDEKLKTISEMKLPTDNTHELATKTETTEVKKVGNVQQSLLQTPHSKKSSVQQIEGQKIIGANASNSATSGHIKSNIFTSTPVRTVNSIVTKQTQPQVHRVISTTTSKPSSATTSQTVPCNLCKKPARPNTIYCSDDCIRRTAQNAINVYTAKSTEQQKAVPNNNTPDDKRKKNKGLFEDLLSMADRKPKVERIVVYDRNSGTKLSGSSAPTTLTIKKWLHDNPSFEVVLPGSQLSIEIEKQQQPHQRAKIAPKQVEQIRASNIKAEITPTTSRPKQTSSPVNQNPPNIASRESLGSQSTGSPSPAKVVKHAEDKSVSHGNVNPSRPNTPKQLHKISQHIQVRAVDNKSPRNETKEETKSKDRQLKRQSSDISTSSSSSNKKPVETAITTSDTEPVRKNVRRTLKEQILQRMNESPLEDPTNTGHDDHISTNYLKMTPQEVENFVKEMEAEMFNTFNRDTGTRYKTKYRTLIFNIKDRKNRTLFAKICAKQIDPKQLVHMTPEELASQELAQWRQNENKHQLEMIKKSELDLLSCSKNYVFKNHKGEEMIESKEKDVCVNLDMTIPVEDVVNVLNNSTLSNNNDIPEDISGSEHGLKQAMSSHNESIEAHEQHTHRTHESHHHNQHDSQKEQEPVDEKGSAEKLKLNRNESEKKESRGRDRRHRSKSRDYEKDRDRERHQRSKSKDSEKDREGGREKRHRSRDRYHRDKSRSKRRSHSRSKSRGRSEEKRYKSSSHSHKEEHRDHEKERDRERDKHRDIDRDYERKEKKSSETKVVTGSTSSKMSASSHIQSKEKRRCSPTPSGVTKHKHSVQQKSSGCFNLIDQIIESSKTVEEAANLVRDTNKEKMKEQEKPKEQQSPLIATSSAVGDSTASIKTIPSVQCTSTTDSDQEPTSTVSIPTPPHDLFIGEEEPSFSKPNSPNVEELWSGGLSMNEVASLQIKLVHLIGNSRNIGKYMPENLDVVGRIDGNTVWDYLSKIRKSPNKEIVLLRLVPYSEDETEAYTKLFQYLDQKKRLGVIKSIMQQIKDFYIFPLGAGKHLPKVLQVTSRDDFYNDPFRPDMIIGVIVRVLGKRMSAPVASNSHVSTSTAMSKLPLRNRDEMEQFTQPGSPKRRKHTHKGSIDLDAIIKAPIVPVKKVTNMTADEDEPYSPGGSSDDDTVPQYTGKTSSSMLLGLPGADEDLKRKMEEINRQIAAQEMEIAGLLNVEPTASASVLANISIPSNLPQILASIKNKDVPVLHQHLGTGTSDEYRPEEISSYSSSGARHSINNPSSSSTSRLAQLSEAELLSMVPDDIMLDPAPNSSAKKPLAIVSPYYQEPPPPGI